MRDRSPPRVLERGEVRRPRADPRLRGVRQPHVGSRIELSRLTEAHVARGQSGRHGVDEQCLVGSLSPQSIDVHVALDVAEQRLGAIRDRYPYHREKPSDDLGSELCDGTSSVSERDALDRVKVSATRGIHVGNECPCMHAGRAVERDGGGPFEVGGEWEWV